MTPDESPVSAARFDVWARRTAAALVAAVAAYGSYEHQRTFALAGGADATSAGLWPLSVDGLLVLATVRLLKSRHHKDGRIRLAAWLAFGLGIAVSLARTSPRRRHWPGTRSWSPVGHRWPCCWRSNCSRMHQSTETEPRRSHVRASRSPETDHVSAEEVMWNHFEREVARGRTPTGAELDRVAGTNNFGRAVLRRWRRDGRIPAVPVLSLGSASDAPNDPTDP